MANLSYSSVRESIVYRIRYIYYNNESMLFYKFGLLQTDKRCVGTFVILFDTPCGRVKNYTVAGSDTFYVNTHKRTQFSIFSANTVIFPWCKNTYTMRRTAGMMSPGLVAYVKTFPTKAGRSCSIVCMMMSYIFSWPLVEHYWSNTIRCGRNILWKYLSRSTFKDSFSLWRFSVAQVLIVLDDLVKVSWTWTWLWTRVLTTLSKVNFLRLLTKS